MTKRSNREVNRILAANPSSTRVMIARTQANRERIAAEAEAAAKEEARKAAADKLTADAAAQAAADAAAQAVADAAAQAVTDPLGPNEILQRMHDGRPQDIAAENARRAKRKKAADSGPLTAAEATALVETGGIEAVLAESDKRARQARQE